MTSTNSVSYVPTKLHDISRALANMFGEMEGENGASTKRKYLRAAQCNGVFLVSSDEQLARVEESIELLATIHPSRFFILVEDARAEMPRADVCARCHLIPRATGEKPEHLCSEIVRIHFKRQDVSKGAGLLRANVITGAPVELFVFDPLISPEITMELLPLADLVYLNSAQFEHNPKLLTQLVSVNVPIVDMQWIETSAWRDQLRAMFEGQELATLVRGIAKIEIGYSKIDKSASPLLPMLIAGWFIDRLHLTVLGRSGNSFDCQAPHGASVRLSVTEQALEGNAPALHGRTAILTSINVSGIVRGGKQAQLRIERQTATAASTSTQSRSSLLETTVRMDKTFKFSRNLDEETESEHLKKYFMIGESITNFRGALKHGLALCNMVKHS